MCQPLGTIEIPCQSLCLLRHHSRGETGNGLAAVGSASHFQPGLLGTAARTRGAWAAVGGEGGGRAAGFVGSGHQAAIAPLQLGPWHSISGCFPSLTPGRVLIRTFTQLQAVGLSGFRSSITKQWQAGAVTLFVTVWSSPVWNEVLFLQSFKCNGLQNEEQISSSIRQWISITKPLGSQFYLGMMGKTDHRNGKSSLTASLPENLGLLISSCHMHCTGLLGNFPSERFSDRKCLFAKSEFLLEKATVLPKKKKKQFASGEIKMTASWLLTLEPHNVLCFCFFLYWR